MSDLNERSSRQGVDLQPFTLMDTDDGFETSTNRDVHHDPWLMPASPDLQRLAVSIFQHLEDSCTRPVRQRTDAKERRRSIIGNIVANIAILSSHPGDRRLAVSADNKAMTRYDRPMFSREVFIQMAREMEECGFLEVRKGRRGKLRTTIKPTATFRNALSGLDILIGRQEGSEPIILKARNGRGRPKVLIDYKDTLETLAMRSEMGAVNGFLKEADIRRGDAPPSSPIFLARYFQIDSPKDAHTFDQHGRLYGSFWMSMDKTERYLLRVNGEEVVDLDFSAMFPTLAYLREGLSLPNSDPYDIEGLPRNAAKIAISALLSRRGPMLKMPKELRDAAGKGWTAKTISKAIAERHPGIAHLFGTGVGLSLMKTESAILMETLLGLFAIGIPALPMHDGLMCPASQEVAARKEMTKAAMRILGVAIPISRKDIARPSG